MHVAAYLRDNPAEIVTADDPDAVFDRYHAPGFVLTNDGTPLDRDALLAHARPARRRVSGVTVDVREALSQDDRVAACYTLVAELRKGHTVRTEIVMVGRLAPDGRLQTVHKLTRDVTPH